MTYTQLWATGQNMAETTSNTSPVSLCFFDVQEGVAVLLEVKNPTGMHLISILHEVMKLYPCACRAEPLYSSPFD